MNYNNLDEKILGVGIDVISVEEAAMLVVNHASVGFKYVCAATVHMIMECQKSIQFNNAVNSAWLVVPDGKPLVWALKALGKEKVEQVTGFSLTQNVLQYAETEGISVGFYGGKKSVLTSLIKKVRNDYPMVKINYQFSPPFVSLSEQEKKSIVKNIIQSNTKILFVGLGCPKQENWMAEYSNQIPAVLIGIGAVFDFLAGSKPRAPKLFQEFGLEWLFRLMLEPKRLWNRYLIQNPRFVLKFTIQLIKSKINN